MVEVVRTAVVEAPERAEKDLFALVTDGTFADMAVPQFALDDAVGLVELIERELLSRADQEA